MNSFFPHYAEETALRSWYLLVLKIGGRITALLWLKLNNAGTHIIRTKHLLSNIPTEC
jgi:hypothetical protein